MTTSLKRRSICLSLIVSMVLPSFAGAAAPSAANPQQTYFATLDHSMPWMTEFAFGGKTDEFPLPKVNPDSPTLDANPFFMASQAWEANSKREACAEDFCTYKDGADLIVQLRDQPEVLRLRERMNAVLLSEDYLMLSADDDRLFKAKVPGEAHPGEGFFFIARKDLVEMGARRAPVPVFFLPVPDEGWTGPNPDALELADTREIVLFNHDGTNLPISVTDLHLLEKVERDNMMLGIAWNFLDGALSPSGIVLPKPNTTVGFGLFLSGVLPDAGRSVGRLDIKRLRQIAAQLLWPSAHASESTPPPEPLSDMSDVGDIEKIKDQVPVELDNVGTKPLKPGGWKQWILPTTLWGGRTALAVAAYNSIDWSKLIPVDMAHRIETVGWMMGSVAVATVLLRIFAHRKLFNEKYPKEKYPNLSGEINRQHKAILDEFTYASYFSQSMIPQGMRHALEFLKDRFLPANKMVNTAWDATMGFQLRTNSQLAMNWKTWWLGVWVYGLTDSMAVFMDLLIFAPWIANHFGWQFGGPAMVAWASSEVFRNFLSYFQSGAHSYSADVKQIHQKSAEKLAKQTMKNQSLDPDDPRNADYEEKLVEEELQKRYTILGLPLENEFMYDPNTALQSAMGKFGYSLNSLSNEQKEELKSSTFILKRRHWGLVKPALDSAFKRAKELQKQSNTALGEDTLKMFSSAQTVRRTSTSILSRAWQTLTQQDRWAELKTKGLWKYLVSEPAQETRDQRLVMFLMSTTRDPQLVMKYLPASWIERAGSPKAAYLAAELFHRSFMALLQKDRRLAKPSAETFAKYTDRATARLLEGQDPPTDLFDYNVRLDGMMLDLKAEDEKREAVQNYSGPKENGYVKRQWSVAREEAERAWAKRPVDVQVSQAWNGLAKAHAERSDEPSDTGVFVDTYKYRLLVAHAFAKNVQLHLEDPETSDFMRSTISLAVIESEKQLAQKNEELFQKSLGEEDRRFYQAKVFTNHLIGNYVSRTVHSDDFMEAKNPGYPGRLQHWRRKLVGTSIGTTIASAGTRFFESLFRNEESSYQPGRFAWFERNIPLLPDMWLNFVRSLRTMPYLLTFSYLTLFYVWQVQSPYALWTLSIMTGFLHPTLVEFNNRLMRNFNIEPMRNAATKATYSFSHGLLTNIEPAVLEKYADPIVNTTNRLVDRCVQALIW